MGGIWLAIWVRVGPPSNAALRVVYICYFGTPSHALWSIFGSTVKGSVSSTTMRYRTQTIITVTQAAESARVQEALAGACVRAYARGLVP